MTTDSIADMLTRVRNAVHARHPRVEMPSSKFRAEVARILKEEGYISNYKVSEEGKKKVLKITLRYNTDGESVISALERVSTPGKRVYIGAREISKIAGGLGISILSTPRGVMTGKNARKTGAGGEVLCYVY